jgi:hypothetical protein
MRLLAERASQKLNYLIHFEDDVALDPSVVGHKFASLARARLSGFESSLQPSPSRVDADDFYRRNKVWPEGLH